MNFRNLKHTIIYSFILIGFSISSSSCNSDNEESIITFLEKFDGSKWSIPITSETIYIRINNNVNMLVEEWVLDEECYISDINFDSVDIEIIENSESTLIIKITDDDDNEEETLTFTSQGGFLKVVINYTEDGEAKEEIILLEESSVDVDSLLLCTS